MTKTNQQITTPTDAATGLKTAIKILDKWDVNTKSIILLLRISKSTCYKARNQHHFNAVKLDCDQLARLSMILNIHATLRLIFENPKNVYGFMNMSNKNEYFEGSTPLEKMSSGDFISIYETFKHINALSNR